MHLNALFQAQTGTWVEFGTVTNIESVAATRLKVNCDRFVYVIGDFLFVIGLF
jgi:hypothetical protein